MKIIQKSLESAEQDFWTVVGATDLELYHALAKRRLRAARATLEKGYADLHRRVKSTRMWGSVYDTACLTLPTDAGRAPKPEREAAQALLARLRKFAHAASA